MTAAAPEGTGWSLLNRDVFPSNCLRSVTACAWRWLIAVEHRAELQVIEYVLTFF